MSTIRDIHNPWRDALVPASYDGNEFFMEVGSREGGNRLVVHQFPKKDQPYTEMMGRRAIEFRVRGYVIMSSRQQDYRPARDALQESLEKGMSGQAADIQLPTMRPMKVYCQRYTMTEEERYGGYCSFDMHFVEAGSAPFKPMVSPQAQLTQAADALGQRNQAAMSDPTGGGRIQSPG